MKLLVGTLALLVCFAAGRADARGIGDYQDYPGSDAGRWVFSLTAGNFPRGGVFEVQVHFHRMDGPGAGGTISWVPAAPFTHDEVSGPLDEKTRRLVGDADLFPAADADYRTTDKVVRLPPGQYEVDWISLDLHYYGPYSVDYSGKIQTRIRFNVAAGRTEYAGALSIAAVNGIVGVKTRFGTRCVPHVQIVRWAVVLDDRMDRDVHFQNLVLDPVDRAPFLDGVLPPPFFLPVRSAIGDCTLPQAAGPG
ncbi:MAG TPA: hypothetical protein VGF50_02325 [Caulobacteraceae bacterium]